MKCKPLILGVDISGMEVLYPSTGRTLDPSVIPNYISQGYNMFRILFRWERLQPSLIPNLITSNTPNMNVVFDATYLSEIMSFVEEVIKNNGIALIQLDNGGWFDVSFDDTFVNDGTKTCPASNYVYINQTSTTIGSVNYNGPTTAQFSNLWITLASQIYNNIPLSNYSNVRFGIGQNTTLDNSIWIPIVKDVIDNIRASNITNTLHYDLQNSSYAGISYVDNITDENSILNINHNNDGNSVNGNSVLTTDDYLMTAVMVNKIIDATNMSPKVSFGDVRFDSGTTSITALQKFISYLAQNISTFESVCLFGIGDSMKLPTSYNLNYITNSDGTITYPTQITDAKSSVGTNTSSETISMLPVNSSVYNFIYDSPFGSSFQSLNAGSLYLPFNILSDGMNLTLECWFKSSSTNTTGTLFGADSMINLVLSNTMITLKIGNKDYLEFKTDKNIFDGTWHHFQLCCDKNSGIYFFIDGKVIGLSNLKLSKFDVDYTKYIGIRSSGNDSTSSVLDGMISNFCVWSTSKNEIEFTPPTSYYVGNEDGLIMSFKFDGDITSSISLT